MLTKVWCILFNTSKVYSSKVDDGNSEGRLHWYKMSFLKSILKQKAAYQSNFQMSRQWLQRSDVFYLTLQRFTVSTYIGDGLQSEDFQTFFTYYWFKYSILAEGENTERNKISRCYIVFLCMVFHIVNHTCHDVIYFPNPDAAASYIVL